MQQLPHGSARDEAVSRFATIVSMKEPAAAIEWLASVTDPKRRASESEYVEQRWLELDPKAADASVNSTPVLSAAAKQRLLKP